MDSGHHAGVPLHRVNVTNASPATSSLPHAQTPVILQEFLEVTADPELERKGNNIWWGRTAFDALLLQRHAHTT